MAQAKQNIEIPPVVQKRLRAARRRWFRLRLTEWLLRTIVAFWVFAAIAMGVDWLAGWSDRRIRLALTLSVLAATVYMALRNVRLLTGGWRTGAMATLIERFFPHLEERWSTLTELKASRDSETVQGSRRMIDRVAAEAAGLESKVEIPLALPSRRLAIWLVGVMGLVVATGYLYFLAPDQVDLLWQRFRHPMQNITLTRLTNLTGDLVVPRGDAVALEFKSKGRVKDTAVLEIDPEFGENQELRLSHLPDAPPDFRFAVASVNHSFRYRLASGDGRTDWAAISAVDRPNLAQVTLRIDPPAYSQLPPVEKDALPRRIRVLEGSSLEVAFATNKPVESLELVFGEQEERVVLDASDGEWYRYTTTLGKNLAFTPHLTDQHGFENQNPPQCRIVVYQDRPPRVEIVTPDEKVYAPADDTIPIAFTASDDFGIARAELVVMREEDGKEIEVAVIPIELNAVEGAKEVEGQTQLDLKPFDLEHGDELTYMVRVYDTRNMEATTGEPGESSGSPTDSGKPDESGEASKSSPSDQTQSGAEGAKDKSPPKEASEKEEKSGQDGAGERSQQQKDEDRDKTTETGESSPTDGASSQDKQDRQKPSEESEQSEGGLSPPNTVNEKPLLDRESAGQSSKQRIKVSEWAGSIDSKARDQLRIDVTKFLEELRKHLADARDGAAGLREHVRGSNPWVPGIHGTQVNEARARLRDSQRTIADLRKLSDDTPYTFVGLQLQEIADSFVAPADTHLESAERLRNQRDNQLDELDKAVFAIEQALARLDVLTKQFEAVVKEEKRAELMQKISKMHQIYVEDMQAFLEQVKPLLNPRSGVMIEVDEALVEQLREKLEQMRDMYNELAKILAEDPELLRRMMAYMRLQGTTLRDQLTLLARREKDLDQTAGRWTEVPEAQLPALKNTMWRQLAEEQMGLAQMAAALHDNVLTWTPRDINADQPVLAEMRELSLKLAMDMLNTSQQLTGGEIDRSAESAAENVENMKLLTEKIGAALEANQDNPRMQRFANKRYEEIDRLQAVQEGWGQKVAAINEGRFGPAGAFDQFLLLLDTEELTGKLESRMSFFRRLPEEVETKATELIDILKNETQEHQLNAGRQFNDDAIVDAHGETTQAVESFERAEETFDELLDLVEKAALDMPPPDGVPSASSLEDFLAMLENEMDAAEKLGAVINWNVMFPGMGQGMGMPLNQMQNSLQDAQLQMEQMLRQLDQHANELAEVPGEVQGAPVNAAIEGEPGERDWNVFAGQLEDQLRQGRETTPPEAYREAIDDYFRTIHRTNLAREPGEQ